MLSSAKKRKNTTYCSINSLRSIYLFLQRNTIYSSMQWRTSLNNVWCMLPYVVLCVKEENDNANKCATRHVIDKNTRIHYRRCPFPSKPCNNKIRNRLFVFYLNNYIVNKKITNEGRSVPNHMIPCCCGQRLWNYVGMPDADYQHTFTITRMHDTVGSMPRRWTK
jgi:hypothetical protein